MLRYSLNAMHQLRMGIQYRTSLDISQLHLHRPVMKALVRWNLQAALRAPITQTMSKRITYHYRGDIESLAKLIKRDISVWVDKQG